MPAAQHPAYPVGLRLTGRKTIVIGGGQVAQRRLPALIAAGADITLISPSATPSVEAMADAGEITWVKRRYEEGDLADAWYVLIATADRAANDRASAEAERGRTWCVRSDDAEAATAWTPATGRTEGVTIAVLSSETADRDPRRTAALRDALVEALRDGTVGVHKERTPGVALVGGGPGDPDLITVRGRRLLAEAGVVRLKGGDPFVFGRGMEEAQALAAEGIPVTVVPGISSSISVPGAAGIPVTHRGVAHEFTVVSGHVAPDDERSLVDWAALAKLTGTLVILMGVDKIGKIAEALVSYGKAPDTPVALVQEGTTAAQRRVDATLATVGETVLAEGVKPPAVIVIGSVVHESPVRNQR
jgi:uroporphyrin-III C-methyltransferase/precorrin-2 dehydrogenase/sirohydrochlorin ferrochelatase